MTRTVVLLTLILMTFPLPAEAQDDVYTCDPRSTLTFIKYDDFDLLQRWLKATVETFDGRAEIDLRAFYEWRNQATEHLPRCEPLFDILLHSTNIYAAAMMQDHRMRLTATDNQMLIENAAQESELWSVALEATAHVTNEYYDAWGFIPSDSDYRPHDLQCTDRQLYQFFRAANDSVIVPLLDTVTAAAIDPDTRDALDLHRALNLSLYLPWRLTLASQIKHCEPISSWLVAAHHVYMDITLFLAYPPTRERQRNIIYDELTDNLKAFNTITPVVRERIEAYLASD